MTKSRFHFLARRLHRWLGVIIGIQFLAWTLGGLYFSWSDMDEVHGDYDKAPVPLLAASADYAPPAAVLDSLRQDEVVDSIADLRLVSILGRPHWLATYFPKGHERHHKKMQLADALTGALRPPLTQEEAVSVAEIGYAGEGKVQSVEYLTEAGSHHEYREQPLPAYAVSFDDERRSTVYVAAELGTVQRIRNRPWRRFDFLWMLHTMDYRSRDHIANWLLRAFSIFGLLTVASGFTLFFVSRKQREK
ncbi:MAG: hypothetical protein MUC59_14935 [Saprospiraceae bacterium]|jgi:hypothetical protein|nr:hypothetical protein [Saprospiraceae bacterium]